MVYKREIEGSLLDRKILSQEDSQHGRRTQQHRWQADFGHSTRHNTAGDLSDLVGWQRLAPASVTTQQVISATLLAGSFWPQQASQYSRRSQRPCWPAAFSLSYPHETAGDLIYCIRLQPLDTPELIIHLLILETMFGCSL